MASNWFGKIESKMITYIKYKLKEESGAPYPKLNCTTKSENTTPTNFPTLYLHVLSPVEQAQDLENDTINSVLATVEIQVFSNQSEDEVNRIMMAAITEMKEQRWNIIMFPDPQTSNKIASGVARFRRLVTEYDIQ